MKRIAGFVFLAMFLILALGEATYSNYSFGLSDKKEVEIGQRADKQVRRKFGGTYKDKELQKYVETVGLKLVSVCERPNLYYHFVILNNKELNAMAVPGGYVYVTKGMLRVLQNEAQLAAVLGHEIAHIARRHGAEKIDQDMTMNLLFMIAGIVASRSSEKTAKTATRIMRGVRTAYNFAALGYGRQHEFEADWKGTEYAYRVGYDPQGAVQVLNILQEEEKKNPTLMLDFLRSHPKTTERIDKVRQLMFNLQLDPRYSRVKGKFYPERYLKKIAPLYRE